MQNRFPVELPGEPTTPMAWNAWGHPALRTQLSDEVRALLTSVLGLDDTAHRQPAPEARLRMSTLSADKRRALDAVVGASNVCAEDEVRRRYLGGKSTLDLLARRSGDVQDAPDAVVFPSDANEVAELLKRCSSESIAVVAFGGGTSVVGGVDPVREWFDTVVTVSTERMRALTALDVVSRTATLQAGVTGPQAEEMLGRHGLSLGHYPQSFQHASIGGFAATRSCGQASAGYGRFDDMVVGLTVATPLGITRVGRGPASAAGPDLRQIFLGSEGTLGVITDVTVRVHPTSETPVYRAWWFPDFRTGTSAFRDIAAIPDRPTIMRLSDDAETGIDAALSSFDGTDTPAGGCIAIATFEGGRTDSERRAEVVERAVRGAGGTVVDGERAHRWEATRFDSPYLRDALLDVGAVAETLETAAHWSDLGDLRAAVSTALTVSLTAVGTPPIVLCHISHVYVTGASLYFTVVFAAGKDPSGSWRTAKAAATDAILQTGGTVTHHHSVGRDHRAWMDREVGDIGTTLLRAMKSAVDPAGILNPGKLIP